MKKQNRNILIGVAILILLYLWWDSTRKKVRENGNGGGTGGRTLCYSNCDAGSYTSLSSTSPCGTGDAANYPLQDAPICNGVQNCTNTCCSANGTPVVPSSYPSCKCPQSDYVYANGQCSLVGVVGCMDTTATNFNAMATIPDANSCLYDQQTRSCFSNCIGSNYNTIITSAACGNGEASNYPYTIAPFCGSSNPTPVLTNFIPVSPRIITP